MKKLLFVIPTMRMGGAEQSLVSLLNTIDLSCYEIDLLLFEKNGELLDRIPPKVNVIAADTITRAMILEFRYFFKDLIQERHYITALFRLIMLANSKLENLIGKKLMFNWNIAKRFIKPISTEYDVAIGYLEGTTDAFIIDKVNAKRKIGWIHTNFGKAKRHFKAEEKYYRKCDAIAVISEACRNSFVELYPELADKTHVIENITDKEAILTKAQEPLEEMIHWQYPCIVTIGRLEKVKGIDIALEAARIMRDKGIKFVWHVFGDGTLKRDLADRIVQYRLEKFFYLDGTTCNPYKYMKNADIIVQPSRNEGKSIVLDEAKLLCRPIVATNYPSAKDQLKDGVTGMIVDINPDSIAEGIEQLLNSEFLSELFARNCSLEKDKTVDIMGRIISMIEGE